MIMFLCSGNREKIQRKLPKDLLRLIADSALFLAGLRGLIKAGTTILFRSVLVLPRLLFLSRE